MDLKLTASANKNVEPNWANISRVEFNDDRNANELSQRWENLTKKQGNIKVANKLTSVQQPDQLAASHRAMSMALDRPKKENFKEASGGLTSQQTKKPFAPPPDQPLGRGGPPKPQAQTERPFMNPVPFTPDSTVKATVVAAGARTSSLLEAAQSRSGAHITTCITSQLSRNVHFIRNGLSKAPFSTYFAAKAAVQPNTVAPTPVQKGVDNAVVSTLGNVVIEDIKYDQVAGPTYLSGSTPVENHVHAENDRVVLPSSEAVDNGKNAVMRNSHAM